MFLPRRLYHMNIFIPNVSIPKQVYQINGGLRDKRENLPNIIILYENPVRVKHKIHE